MHLNELQEKYADQGLSIVAITSEGKNETESWVKNKGAEYPYAYDMSGKLSAWFGVKGIPHAVLLDAHGVVVWKGHPANLNGEVIAGALEGALPIPLYEWTGSAKTARGFLEKGQLAKALAAAQKITPADEGARFADAVARIIEARVARLERLFETGDLLALERSAADLLVNLAGLPEIEAVKQWQEKMLAAPRSSEIRTALTELENVRALPLKKKKDADKVVERLEALIASLPDTYPGKEARKYLTEVEKLRHNLK